MQHKGAQRQADNDSESDVFEGFAVHGLAPLVVDVSSVTDSFTE